VAGHHVHLVHRFFPSGGWGYSWLGDPDRGVGAQQPGSWSYQILPFIEESSAREMGSDALPDVTTPQQRAGAAQASRQVVVIYVCPSRRSPQLFPHVWTALPPSSAGLTYYHNGEWLDQTARCDYKANAGDVLRLWGAGPASLAAGDRSGFRLAVDSTGIVFQGSEVGLERILDGTTHTYFVGEKALNPEQYLTGRSRTDNHALFSGDDWDNVGWTLAPPVHDDDEYDDGRIFGSPHREGVYFAMCDGSVRLISFHVEPLVHRYLGNRRDGFLSAGRRHG
jgi:hypothetical protein